MIQNVVKPSFYIVFISVLVIFWYSFSITYVGLQYISKYSDAINIIILLSPLILTNSLANIGGYILYAPGIDKYKRLYLSWVVTLLVMGSYLIINSMFETNLILLILFFLIAKGLGHMIIYGSVLSTIIGKIRSIMICSAISIAVLLNTLIYLYEINYF